MIWLSTKEDIKEIEKIFYEQGIDKANEEILKHLEKFAKENFMSPHDMALRCVAANQPDKAMDWIEKGFELHDPQMMYIASPGNYFDSLFEYPGFIAICEKMNLPVSK